jgi:hypothetical protein
MSTMVAFSAAIFLFDYSLWFGAAVATQSLLDLIRGLRAALSKNL